MDKDTLEAFLGFTLALYFWVNIILMSIIIGMV